MSAAVTAMPAGALIAIVPATSWSCTSRVEIGNPKSAGKASSIILIAATWFWISILLRMRAIDSSSTDSAGGELVMGSGVVSAGALGSSFGVSPDSSRA